MAWCPLFIFYLSFIISCQALIQCESGNCTIDCSKQNCQTVICTNQASSCTINCTASDCEGSHFYLAASNNNTVTCDGSDSCKNINIQCGLPNFPPIPYTVKDFIGHVDKCEFILQNNAIPDLGTIQCRNDIDLCQVSAITDNDDFKNSNFICQLSPSQAQCVMNCSTPKSCGSSTSVYNCIASQCICNGNGCNQIYQTSSKSSYTDDDEDEPSLEPTMEPTIGSNMRTSIPSTSDLYTAIPTNYVIPTNTNRLSTTTTDTISTADPTKSPTPRPTRSPISTISGSVSDGDPASKLPTVSPTISPTLYIESDDDEEQGKEEVDVPTSVIDENKTNPPSMAPTSRIIRNYQLFDDKLNGKNSNDMIWILSAMIFGLFCISCAICICISVCCDCSDKQPEHAETVDNQSYAMESDDKICPFPDNPSTPSYVNHFNNRDLNETNNDHKGVKHRYSFTEDNDVIMIRDYNNKNNKQLETKPKPSKPLPPCIKHQGGDTLHLHLPKFVGFNTNELKMDDGKNMNYDEQKATSSMSDIPSIPTPRHQMLSNGHYISSASTNQSSLSSEQNLTFYQEPEIKDKEIKINIINHKNSTQQKWVRDESGKWNKKNTDSL